MKLTKEMVDRAALWVEKNGLYPQPCGASVKMFCEAMGISFPTYQRWEQNVNFMSALSRAREVFRQTSVREVSNALIVAAKGVNFTKEKSEYHAQVVKEYDPKTGKKVKEYTTDKGVKVKEYRETFYYPPDVAAAKYVLNNMDPEHWKEKQDTSVSLDVNTEQPPVIVFGAPESQEPDEAKEEQQ